MRNTGLISIIVFIITSPLFSISVTPTIFGLPPESKIIYDSYEGEKIFNQHCGSCHRPLIRSKYQNLDVPSANELHERIVEKTNPFMEIITNLFSLNKNRTDPIHGLFQKYHPKNHNTKDIDTEKEKQIIDFLKLRVYKKMLDENREVQKKSNSVFLIGRVKKRSGKTIEYEYYDNWIGAIRSQNYVYLEDDNDKVYPCKRLDNIESECELVDDTFKPRDRAYVFLFLNIPIPDSINKKDIVETNKIYFGYVNQVVNSGIEVYLYPETKSLISLAPGQPFYIDSGNNDPSQDLAARMDMINFTNIRSALQGGRASKFNKVYVKKEEVVKKGEDKENLQVLSFQSVRAKFNYPSFEIGWMLMDTQFMLLGYNFYFSYFSNGIPSTGITGRLLIPLVEKYQIDNFLGAQIAFFLGAPFGRIELMNFEYRYDPNQIVSSDTNNLLLSVSAELSIFRVSYYYLKIPLDGVSPMQFGDHGWRFSLVLYF